MKLLSKNIIIKYLLVITIAAFAANNLRAQSTLNDTIIIDRVLAVVGAHPILQSDVENTLLRNKSAGMRIEGDEKCATLEDIMASKLLLDQAELDSIEVSDREVEAELDRRLNYFINTAGSIEAIEQQFNMTMPEIKQDFFIDVKEDLLTQRMEGTITQNVKVTPNEVQKFFKKIPEDQMPRIPEQLEIRQIVIKPKISEEERERVISQLNDYREQIIGGKSMATIAILYSDDPGSRSAGGELGYLPKNVLAPEFVAAAFNLRGNEVSRVVKTDFGYHLIQLIGRKGETINARHILLKPNVLEKDKTLAKNNLDTIASVIRKGELDFEKAALKYSSDENTAANGGLLVNPNTGSTKFEPRELPPEVLAQVNLLKVGEISDPFESRDENNDLVYKIIKLKSRLAAHEANLKTDYQYIQMVTLQNKNAEKLNEWLTEKQKGTYIRINKDYQKCQFRNEGWVK